MNRSAWIAGLASALALLITVPANAATSIVQFSGTLSYGIDTGHFTPVNNNFNVIRGQKFLAEYVIQDPTPGAQGRRYPIKLVVGGSGPELE